MPSPGDLPDPGIKPTSLMSPVLASKFFSTSNTWEGPLVSKGHETDTGQHGPSEFCKDKAITLLDLRKVRPALSSFSWGLFWWHDQKEGTRRSWDLGKKTQQVWDKFHLICTQVYIQDSRPGQKGSRIQDWDGVRLELLPGCKCHRQNQKPRHRKEGEEGEVIGQRGRKPGS